MQTNFLVIGERCKDVFIYGKSDRLSPEAPVPVFIPIDMIDNIGMAGNVIKNLKAIIDIYAHEDSINSILSNEGIVKTRYVDKKSNHIFLRVDENDSVEPLVNTSMDEIAESIKCANVIIISDYNKGFLDDNIIYWIATLFPDKMIFLDTKRPLTQEIVSCVDFVKLNEKEYENVPARLKLLFDHKFIITLGSKGAMYKDKIYACTNPVQTIDVSGAGDTFLSAFVFKFVKTKDVAEAIEFANEITQIVVSKRGVSTI